MSKQNKKLQQEITSGFKQMEEVSTVSVRASNKSKKLRLLWLQMHVNSDKFTSENDVGTCLRLTHLTKLFLAE